jgi:hypothetical protein
MSEREGGAFRMMVVSLGLLRCGICDPWIVLDNLPRTGGL